MSRLVAVAGSCLLIVGLTTCSDEITRPETEVAPTSLSMSTTGDPHPPPFTPNGVPYRNPEYKHATGRAGLATLTARALLGMDGITDLEVTTGELDSSDPPPYLMTKLQLKLMGVDEEIDEVQNHNKVGAGYVAYELEGRPWHTNIQVQGNVIAPNASGKQERTGVVTLLERVNLRPDLAVSGLYAPSQAESQSTVSIAAIVTELNGDVGARANCVLYVDGSESDRADGIWVAENGHVVCQFVHYFTAVGTHDLEVRVEEVTPGDWDLGNNSITGSIEIVSVPLHGNIYANWYKSDYDRQSIVEWYRSCGSACEEWYNSSSDYQDDHLQFYGYVHAHPASGHYLEPPYDYEVVEYMDGAPAVMHSMTDLAGTACNTYWSFGASIEVCPGGPTFLLLRYNSESVYWSSGSWNRTRHSWYTYCVRTDSWGNCIEWGTVHDWDYWYESWGPYVYTYVSPPEGILPPFATPWGVDIHLFGADGSEFTAQADISSYDHYHYYGYPRSWSQCYAITGGQECWYYDEDRQSAWGNASF